MDVCKRKIEKKEGGELKQSTVSTLGISDASTLKQIDMQELRNLGCKFIYGDGKKQRLAVLIMGSEMKAQFDVPRGMVDIGLLSRKSIQPPQPTPFWYN